MNEVCPHKGRTGNKNTKGMFTSFGKASEREPHEGNLWETTHVWRKVDQMHEERTAVGRGCVHWTPTLLIVAEQLKCSRANEWFTPSSGKHHAW